MTEETQERQPSRRRRILLFGCGGLILISLCLVALVAVANLIPGGAEDVAVTAEEVVGEVDERTTIPAEEGQTTTEDATVAESAEEEAVGEAEPSDTPAPTATAAPTETPQPTPTATPLPQGLARSNPFPGSAVVNAPNWDVEVLEVIRGDEAWTRIQQANQFNEPPPEGMEYVLVRVRAASTYADEETHRISGSDFKVTGDRFVCSSPASAVAPEPELRAELGSGGEATGWIPFLVGANEGNLLLLLDELFNFDDDRFRYIALQDGASVTVPDELAGIEPTDEGRSRQEPLPPGETAVTEDWEVSVLEVIRGDEAWARIQQANQFNEPPREGMEYVLMRVGVRNISTAERYLTMDEFAFNPTGSANVLHDLPSVVSPEPVFDTCLYPGGRAEGWVSMQVYSDETDLMARFEPAFEWFDDEQARFLALEEGASVSVSPELAQISPDETGVDRSDPAALGETVITEDWQITVQEVVRGDEAWTMVQEANQFNDPPAEGMEYVAVRVHVRYIGTEDETENIDAFAFRTMGDQNVRYEIPSVVDPQPVLDVSLYPGGEYEGWATYQAALGESNVLLLFDEGFFSGERYLSLQP